MARLIVLDNTGHTDIDFQVDVQEQVERAQKQFEELVNSGTHMAILTKKGVGQELVTDFGKVVLEEDTEIVISPRLVGG
jgi:hypothetical protein